MNFGFDLEGTLDAEPHMFGALCYSLIKNGHAVYVITAYWSEDGQVDQGQIDLRRRQLVYIGFESGIHFTDILFAPGSTVEQQGERKRELCANWMIGLMFEDRQEFTDIISKSTRCFLIQPRVYGV
jgi:hypothetical protein